MKNHPLLLLFGPSSSGKDTVFNLTKKILLNNQSLSNELNLQILPSLVSRPIIKRDQEDNYIFISEQEFLEKIKNKEFIEYNKYVGNYYGSSKKLVLEKIKKGITIKQIDINGFKKITNDSKLKYNKKDNLIYIDNQAIKVFFIGLVRESIEATKQALIKRDGYSDNTQKRIDIMKEEYDFIKNNADFLLINFQGKPEKCAEELINLIKRLNNSN